MPRRLARPARCAPSRFFASISPCSVRKFVPNTANTPSARVYQRFAEALSERPIELNFTFLAGHATFDRQAFEMWHKYGKALTAPAEVEADLPGGLGGAIAGGVVQVSIGPAGQTHKARFRIRKPDGTTGDPLPFSITVTSGTAGDSGHGTDQTGFLTFEVISDRESRTGTWHFTRKKIVGADVTEALPSVQFLQELHAPNVLQIAQKYGQFQDYAEIPPNNYVSPDALVDYLRALAIIQTVTATPILIPDLTMITVGDVQAVTEAAALISGQTVVDTWVELGMAGDASLQPAGEQGIDLANEYELLVLQQLVVHVGEQELTLGTIATSLLSARYEVDDGHVFGRPFRNNTAHKTFSPNPDAAGPVDRRVLGKVIGRIDDPTT